MLNMIDSCLATKVWSDIVGVSSCFQPSPSVWIVSFLACLLHLIYIAVMYWRDSLIGKHVIALIVLALLYLPIMTFFTAFFSNNAFGAFYMGVSWPGFLKLVIAMAKSENESQKTPP